MTSSRGKRERPRLLRPFAKPDPDSKANAPEDSQVHMASTTAEQLPMIDQFVDDLPPIDVFLLPMETPVEAAAWPQIASRPLAVSPSPSAQLEMDTEGWAAADWQSYDWSGLATLGAPDPEAAQAHAEWTSTNWTSTARDLREIADRSNEIPGSEVADALDEIARRIRSGELSLEQFRDTPPEAAIAAAFGALLRTKG